MKGQALDAVVIGAGFSGLYALHKLRRLGLAARVFELGDNVGGTWFWNRYPGARCDLESIEYSYSFSKEIEDEWVWTELMPPQSEIEAYANFVVDRLDLRRDIQFQTRVTSLAFDERAVCWVVETEHGQRYRAQFVIAASGLLSVPLDPQIPGMGRFAGESVFSSRYPRDGVAFGGKRVALIGTGSTGVQAAPVLAEQAQHLYVFQRSAAYTFPSPTRPYRAGEFEALKADYPAIRQAQRLARAGAARTSAFAVLAKAQERPPLKTASRAEQLRAIDEFGVLGALYWSDVTQDMEASELARHLYGEAVARVVKDPQTAASLVPDYPFGCKRPIIDVGYYETFNRDNVTLVDLKKGPIEEITETGIRTRQGSFEVDTIFYATGFDAMTGALTKMDIRGRGGKLLRDIWKEEGPVSYLGLQVAGFPNLFTVIGPGSPGALANVISSLEFQVDWIAGCIEHLRDHALQTVEAKTEAQAAWVKEMNALVEGSVVLHPSCHSWWIGANVPGKKRMFMSYAAGFAEYCQRCRHAADAGYAGFALA
jgi:cation diffusion facilitator CzcD-associated flavoprotein CzcO